MQEFLTQYLTKLLMRQLRRKPSLQAAQAGNYFVLRCGPLFKSLSVLLLALMTGIAAGFVWTGMRQQEAIKAAGLHAFAAVIVILALYLVVDCFYSKILFDDVVVIPRSPIRRSRKIPWSEVKGITYNDGCSWYVVDAGWYGTFRIPEFMNGCDQFLQLASKLGVRFG